MLPEFQGNGIGKLIMAKLIDYVNAKAKPGSFVSLFSNKGLAEFYRRFGFEVRPEDSPGMSFMVPPPN